MKIKIDGRSYNAERKTVIKMLMKELVIDGRVYFKTPSGAYVFTRFKNENDYFLSKKVDGGYSRSMSWEGKFDDVVFLLKLSMDERFIPAFVTEERYPDWQILRKDII